MQNLIIKVTRRFLRVSTRLYGLLSTGAFYCKAWAQGIVAGRKLLCWGKVYMNSYSPKSICFGESISIVSQSGRCTASSIYSACKFQTLSPGARIILEDGVSVNGVSIVARSKTIRIGKNTMIAPNCTIVDSDFHSLWPAEGRLINPGIEHDKGVNIGENVWLGMQVVVLKGVTIGDGAVIGARSVVTSDIPSNCVAAGVPAKIIRHLP